ncbi:Ldh family oxidoreductase [Pseudalkalibacillus sp. A8]|uniref:Ldh family oxidoreductase n=1 Tax=Pseudalkalibacillus sp. A8 TaxID=3382641 RepID=UPI0038B6A9D8
MRIGIDALDNFVNQLLIKAGLTESDAASMTNVYRRATLRGIGHHDIYDLPKRLHALSEGLVKIKPEITMVGGFNAIENYNGDNGLGEICTSFIMNRSKALADSYGIGFCTIYNSNHFLSASPYVEQLAEDGYFCMIWSSTQPVMGWPNSGDKLIGNNPMGFGTPGKSNSILLDISMAYSSIGGLHTTNKEGRKISKHTAVDVNGNYTDNPLEALHGASLPIGEHKGFGLALLGELLTSVLSGGVMIEEKSKLKQLFGEYIHAQTMITIKTDVFMSEEQYKQRVNQLQEFIKGKESNVRIPGERSLFKKAELEQKGVWINGELREELNVWAERFHLSARI